MSARSDKSFDFFWQFLTHKGASFFPCKQQAAPASLIKKTEAKLYCPPQKKMHCTQALGEAQKRCHRQKCRAASSQFVYVKASSDKTFKACCLGFFSKYPILLYFILDKDNASAGKLFQ